MAKHKKRTRRNSRDAPVMQQRSVMLVSEEGWNLLCQDGYRPIAECAEVKMCINAYARAVATMTIHLLKNVSDGNVRVHNALSRKVDIAPAPYMGRANMMYMIVRQMMSNGNALVYPEYRDGELKWLWPLKPSRTQIIDGEDDYTVLSSGRTLRSDEVLNYVFNPDPDRPWRGQGVTVDVADMVKAIRQADTTRSNILASPTPSIIVKVTDFAPEFQQSDGQEKLSEKYAKQSRNGKPWFIPAEAIDVTTVAPLNLNDLAIKDNLELDKRAVAAMIGIPAYMVGVGAYNEQEHNNFVSTKLPFVSQIIDQENTSKLLMDGDMFFRLSKRSLMAYSIKDLVSLGKEMVDRQAMYRNEWRDLLDFPPDEAMNELLALENYIPANRLGDQKKLIQQKEVEEDGEQ